MNAVQDRHAIYYPMIRFRDEGWLKSTALYWDSLARVVPSDYSPQDSEDVRRLIDAEFVRNLPPNYEALNAVHDDIVRLLEDKDKRTVLEECYGVRRIDQWLPDAASPTSASYAGRDRDQRLGYLLGSRVSGKLQQALVDSGLARRMDDQGWLGTHPSIADLVMRSLANEIATARRLHPLTDRAADHAVGVFTLDRLVGGLIREPERATPMSARSNMETHLETRLAQLAFTYVRLAAPDDLSIDRLVRFRNDHVDERRRFQENVASLVKDLADINVADELDFRLQDGFSKIKRALDDLERAMRGKGIATKMGSASAIFQAPGAIAASLGLITAGEPLGVAGQIAAGVLGLAIGSLPFWFQGQSERVDRLAASNVAYLYSMGHELSAEMIAEEVNWEQRRRLAPYV